MFKRKIICKRLHKIFTRFFLFSEGNVRLTYIFAHIFELKIEL